MAIRAINSVGECYLHTVEVTGSNPVSPTSIYRGLGRNAGASSHILSCKGYCPAHAAKGASVRLPSQVLEPSRLRVRIEDELIRSPARELDRLPRVAVDRLEQDPRGAQGAGRQRQRADLELARGSAREL